MISILFFLPSLTGGGAERTIINIANALDRKKYSVHFLIVDRPVSGKYKDEYYGLLKDDIIVHNLSIPILKKNYIKIVLEMRKIIKMVSPDIAMSTMLRPNMMLLVATKIGKRTCKLVLRESNNRSKTSNWIEKLAIKYMYGRIADKTVSLSEGVKTDLCANLGVDGDNVRVIYNPIDIEEIEKLAAEDVEVPGTNIIVAAGRLHKQKNYPAMIKALSLLKESTDFHMYILGKGELEGEISKMIDDEGLTERVSMVGFQANPYKYMARAKIFLLTSDWEGFGHVIVEAMVCGAAVIATDCPYGPGEIINSPQNGILIPIGDYYRIAQAVRDLICDEELRSKIKRNGMERARDFSVKKIVKEYEILFDEVARGVEKRRKR